MSAPFPDGPLALMSKVTDRDGSRTESTGIHPQIPA
jgi:hypothetical protein